MKLFRVDCKVNFVDENNVVLGYDMDQNCCEHADWFIADNPMMEIVERGDDPDLTGWAFDPAYFRKWQDMPGKYDVLEEGDMAIFRMTNGDAEQFLHLFNAHNGYYGHGFEFLVGGEERRTGVL